VNNPRNSHTLRSWSHQYQAQAETLDLDDPGKQWLIALNRAGDERRPLIPRGAGLSWTDIAMAEGGLVATTASMNAVTAFDTAGGRITAQSGIGLGDLLERILPHGWTLNCLPGSLDVTLGGAIGCNVHGKDTFHHGAFCEQIERLSLADGKGQTHDLLRDADTSKFDAVAGGMGLMGLVCDATLKLSPVPASHIALEQHAVDGVGGMTDLIDSAGGCDFLWGWLEPKRAMLGEVRALATTRSWTEHSEKLVPDLCRR
jgi:decaprenylphospho-beta-D-ribofuranose 2-oxidase